MVTVQAEVTDIGLLVKAATELKQRAEADPGNRWDQEVVSFFEAIVSKRAFFLGNKGDVLLWGGVWNYFRGDDFTDWIARLVAETPSCWGTNVHLTWELEQQQQSNLRVVWPEQFRGYAVMVADVPPDMRWHWGVCSYSGVPARALARLDGFPWSRVPMDTCQACKRTGVKFTWVAGMRVCSNCDNRRPFVEVKLWKEPEDEGGEE